MNQTPTIDELENRCFGCGQNNPQGLRLRFDVRMEADGGIVASTTLELSRTYEGAPGYVHGGILAVLLDEAMSKLNRPQAVLAMTRHMEVDYLRPVPVDTPLYLEGRTARREGRKLFHTAQLRLLGERDGAGRPLCTGKALFVAVDAGLLAKPLPADEPSPA